MDGNSNRRWFQLSLRTLLGAMTVVAVCIGIVANRARNQQQACAAIRQLGGHIQYDYAWNMNAGSELPKSLAQAEPFAPKWLRDYLGEDFFVSVSGVCVTSATDRNLGFLQQMAKLQSLSIEKSAITDNGLVAIVDQTELVYLWLDDTQIGDAGLTHLSGMKKLRFLYIHNANVTDKGIDALKRELPAVRVCYGRDPASKIK